MVSPTAHELAKRLVEQNIGIFRRQLTREELLRIGGECDKNELRRKVLCFICKEPKRPDHSCLSDMEEMAEGDQEEVPFEFSNRDFSFIVESMGSYEGDSEEHEQSCRVVDSNLDMHPCVMEKYDE